jgi:hypothetical protein
MMALLEVRGSPAKATALAYSGFCRSAQLCGEASVITVLLMPKASTP